MKYAYIIIVILVMFSFYESIEIDKLNQELKDERWNNAYNNKLKITEADNLNFTLYYTQRELAYYKEYNKKLGINPYGEIEVGYIPIDIALQIIPEQDQVLVKDQVIYIDNLSLRSRTRLVGDNATLINLNDNGVMFKNIGEDAVIYNFNVVIKNGTFYKISSKNSFSFDNMNYTLTNKSLILDGNNTDCMISNWYNKNLFVNCKR